jgi:nitrite reductase/ring-hydroxylating ferredoxin subunit
MDAKATKGRSKQGNNPALGQPYSGYHAKRGIAEDAELTHVGPGTPGGEYLRRFWQPVALSSELADLPLNVRMLGEDLVLFRTRSGELGLLERHCSHRGASLEYGLPSEQGIVCCYHGWHFATDGRIIETPNDPTSKAAGQLYHGAYPTHEYEGIIFTYMGPPQDMSDFPILDTYVEPDNEMVPFSLHMPCNWLQVLENTQDPTHSCFLHTRVSGIQFGESWGELPELDYVKTPFGMINVNVRRWKDKIWVRTTEDILPNMNQAGSLWLSAEEEVCFDRVALTRWMMPVDDADTKMIGWRYFNDRVDAGLGDKSQVGLGTIDFIGQTEDERPYEERQRVPGDFEAIVSQRDIAIHGLENLTLADRGVGMLRGMVRQGIKASKAGKKFASLPRRSNGAIATYTQDTIITRPPGKGDDRKLMREMGREITKVVLDSDKLTPEQRVEAIAKMAAQLA